MCDQDRFDHEVTRQQWYEEQDKDEKWIAEQEAITNNLNHDYLSHMESAFDMIFKGKK